MRLKVGPGHVAEGETLAGGTRRWYQLPGTVAHPGGIAQALVDELGPRLPETQVRHTLLGHFQRGSVPTTIDRVLATRIGVAAAQALDDAVFGITIALQGERCVRLPLTEVAGLSRLVTLGRELLAVAKALGVVGLTL
ncbi:MAG: 6-phosphofructokinase [Burkholderiales bacterium]